MLKSVSRKLRTPSVSAVSVRRADASDRRTTRIASTSPASRDVPTTAQGSGTIHATTAATTAVISTCTPTSSAALPARLNRDRSLIGPFGRIARTEFDRIVTDAHGHGHEHVDRFATDGNDHVHIERRARGRPLPP